jgi:hypothetical protein
VLEPTPARSWTDRVMGSQLPELVGAVLASVQAWVFSVLVVVVPVAVAAATATVDADRTWWSPVRAGLILWLLGHGLPATVSGAQVGLVPLGVTMLAAYTVHASTRRSGTPTSAGLVVGVGAYAVLAALTAVLVGVGPIEVAAALIGGATVGMIGSLVGLLGVPGSPLAQRAAHMVDSVAVPVRAVVRAGTAATVALVGAAGAVVSVWVLAGRATIGDVVSGLGLDPVGAWVLAVGELVYLPDLVVWAVAWIAGPGFSVGAGTSFTAGAVVAGPMPAVPLLGALPSSPAPGARLVVGTVVLVGVLAGVILRRRASGSRWWSPFVAAVGAGLVAGTWVALLVAMASGSLGPGRMSQIGSVWWQVGGAVGGLVALGAAVVVVPSSAAVRARVVELVRSGVGRRPVS